MRSRSLKIKLILDVLVQMMEHKKFLGVFENNSFKNFIRGALETNSFAKCCLKVWYTLYFGDFFYKLISLYK